MYPTKLAALLLLCVPAVAAEPLRERLPFAQSEVIVCTDGSAPYLQTIASIGAERFGKWITVSAATATADLGNARRIYVGHPVGPSDRPACLERDPQLADFLDYFLRYTPRTRVVVHPTMGEVPTTLVATGAVSPLNTVAANGAIAVYVCFSEASPCLEELTSMVFLQLAN